MTTLVVDLDRLARIVGTLRFAAAKASERVSASNGDHLAASQMFELARQGNENADMLSKSVVPSGVGAFKGAA